MDAINKQGLRITKLLGMDDVKKIVTSVGPEQEYFLIDRDIFEARPDLIYCGRTLFGSKPPKRQELNDHYFGAIKPRVKAFMEDLNEELWKVGILSRTEHNEVAPSQHEMAPIYTETNVALDHNQLTMEILKKVAERHNMACLLHEKPFAGVNGSGKHTNWSISTDTGIGLLNPGKKPEENTIFLLTLAAVIKATDEYQDLLRVSVASAGNDHRLGANEAPPAIVSVFLGTELTNILEAIEKGKQYNPDAAALLKLSGDVIPALTKDNTDRNRTSPFAFTGNKFEFRMLGSEFSIAGPNIVLNTIVAEALNQFADKLEKAADKDAAMKKLIKETIVKHKRIVFNGDGYTDAWVEEAKSRGLLNLKSTPEALPYMEAEKNIELFVKHGIFTAAEVRSRVEIMLEKYAKTINIEALTMLDMLYKDILPAAAAYTNDLLGNAAAKKDLGIKNCFEADLAAKISELTAKMYNSGEKLAKALKGAEKCVDMKAEANYYHDTVLKEMELLRSYADAAEELIGEDYLPYPTYGKLLYGVNN